LQHDEDKLVYIGLETHSSIWALSDCSGCHDLEDFRLLHGIGCDVIVGFGRGTIGELSEREKAERPARSYRIKRYAPAIKTI